MEKSGARRSGYHAPSKEEIEEIEREHNTAPPGSVTADEAVREAREAGELTEEPKREEERPNGKTSLRELPEGMPERNAG